MVKFKEDTLNEMKGSETNKYSYYALNLPSVITRAHEPARAATSGGIARPYCKIICVWDLWKDRKTRMSSEYRHVSTS